MSGKLRSMTAVYLRNGERLLLLYRQGGRVVNNVYTGSAGGHFEPQELYDAQACVLREMEEELSLTADKIANLQLRYITLRYHDGEVRQNYYFFADLICPDEELSSNEGTLEWVDMDRALSLDMPVSAKHAIRHYIEKGRFDDRLYGGIVNADGVDFAAMT